MTTLTLKKPRSTTSIGAKKYVVKPEKPVKKTKKPRIKNMKMTPKQYKEALELLKSWKDVPVIKQCLPMCIYINRQKPFRQAVHNVEKNLVARRALHIHTKSRRYIEAMLKHDKRYNVNAEPVQDLLPKHKAYAQLCYDDLARREEKKKRFAKTKKH